ncbi:hypothetical protein Tco_1318390 [Tanacetum coccineum]
MLALGNYIQWKSRIKRYIDTKPNNELIYYFLQNLPYTYQWTEKTVPVAEGSFETTTKRYMENYKNVSQDIRDQLNAEAEAVQIILTGIDNDIYSTVDACPNACEMWKAIERLKQVLTSTSTRMAKNEVNEIRVEILARTANPLALVAQQQPVYHPQNHPTHNNQYSSTRSQQATRNRGKAIVNSSAPNYDQEPATVTKDDEVTKEKEIDKLMDLISLSFKKIYKPINNNLRTSSNTSRANQDNSPRINRGIGVITARNMGMYQGNVRNHGEGHEKGHLGYLSLVFLVIMVQMRLSVRRVDDSLVRAATIATSLDAELDRGNINKIRSKARLNEPSFPRTSSSSGPSGEDRLKLKELMELCTNLQIRVLDLETTKTTQANEISKGLNPLKMKTDEDMFGVNDLDGDEVIVESVDVVNTAEETRSVVEEVTAVTIPVSAATTTTTTTAITDVEMTLAQALAELKSAKPKADKVVIQEPEQGTTTPTLTTTTDATTITAVSTRPRAKGLVIHEQEQAPTPTVSSQQPSQVKVQDKGKGKMVEPEPVKKMSKKELLRLDEELAFKLQAEEEEEERLAREKAQQVEEANIAWDDVQAKIDADYQLAQRLQAQEQDELTDEEKARLFVQFLEQRRKHFAAKRAEEKRNKPPTRAQQRSIITKLVEESSKKAETELVEESSKKAEAEITH